MRQAETKTATGFFLLLIVVSPVFGHIANKRIISKSDLRDKIAGYWLGQIVGNHFGFPFELLYTTNPVPFDITRFYTGRDRGDYKIAANDARGHMDIISRYLEGVPSDDDHDLEFVTLHALEQYGLDITYAEIAPLLASSCNRRIWASTRDAVNMIRQGMLPPATGSKAHNSKWGDLMASISTEIWGAFYPGMTAKAADGAEWFGRISNDGYAIHLARLYAAMYSAAFFEDDLDRLLALGLQQIPADSLLTQGIRDVQKWGREHPQWRSTRKLIIDKYYDKTKACKPVVDALPNGLVGIMALIYAEADYKQTLSISTSAGLDSDNQPATAGGLIGVMVGEQKLPRDYTFHLKGGASGPWSAPYNDTYVNMTRDGLPIRTANSALVDRILAVAEDAILKHGGQKRANPQGDIEYVIITDF